MKLRRLGEGTGTFGSGWTGGNRFELLENGEEFFPAVFSAIESARREVLIETFILFEDEVGLALHAVLVAAARRGVKVDMMVDGFGSPALSAGFIGALDEAGARLHVFDSPPRLSRRLKLFRRLHCKIVVVDGERGFIGGLNYSVDHLAESGAEAKQDYAVEAEGPVVDDMRAHALRLIGESRPAARIPGAEPRGRSTALFAARDNHRHRDVIERHYREALARARREVIIANAYFFPGYRFLKSLQYAARRGVNVQLILQGRPDLPWAAFFARMLYEPLLKSGVCIHEYCQRPMHGKVALVDDDWATIGSSNLDPLSLSLNLEANVVIRDPAFNAALREKLAPLLRDRCRRIDLGETVARRWWWRLGLGALAFHVMRHFPRWAARLPTHRPKVLPAHDTAVVVPTPVPPEVRPWDWRGRQRPSRVETSP